MTSKIEARHWDAARDALDGVSYPDEYSEDLAAVAQALADAEAAAYRRGLEDAARIHDAEAADIRATIDSGRALLGDVILEGQEYEHRRWAQLIRALPLTPNKSEASAGAGGEAGVSAPVCPPPPSSQDHNQEKNDADV